MKRIVLTGGGTAGHVTPNLALVPKLLENGWDIHYIGTEKGIERALIEKEKSITYHIVKSGKLRRYMDFQNFTDPFRVVHGVGQSINLIHKLKPKLIFSKGGFVSVPVVLGGWTNRVPVIIHESDITPGLANKISYPFASKVCTTFPETAEDFKGDKGIYTGTPLRMDLLKGDEKKGIDMCGFGSTKPVLMIMGGSQGAVAINKLIRDLLPKLVNRFNVVHLCGKGNLDSQLDGTEGYRQFEYINKGLPHIMALAKIIVSRAGANSIYEFLALKKPNVLIPLPLSASRGDQILNAQSFQKQGFSKALDQEGLTEYNLLTAILDVYANREKYIAKMSENDHTQGVNKIIKIINQTAK